MGKINKINDNKSRSDDNFKLIGIVRSASTDKKVISNADKWLVERFEEAIRTEKFSWKDFGGGIDNNIYT